MYFYICAVLMVFSIWLIIFLRHTHVRKEMLMVGILLTPFVVFDTLTVPSYWTPTTLYNVPVGIEGILFTFFMRGIAAVLHQTTFGVKYHYEKIAMLSCRAFVLPSLLAIACVSSLKLNAIYLFILGNLFLATTIVRKRKDLLTQSLASGLLFGLLYFLTFSLWLRIFPDAALWWNSPNLSNIKIGLVPIEEGLFGASVGLFVGPFYKFITNGSKSAKKGGRSGCLVRNPTRLVQVGTTESEVNK